MAESKRTFQAAKMERDLDERLVQPGAYKDALNISVASSEDSNTGAVENLKGNNLLSNQNIIGLQASNNPKVIGNIAHPEEKKIYYFVAGDTTDAIYEYDKEANNGNGDVKIILIDSIAEVKVNEVEFTFDKADVSASVAQNGVITVSAPVADVNSVTPNFDPNETGSAITQSITVAVTVPVGWANEGKTIVGAVNASQPSKTEPIPVTLPNTERQVSSTKLNGRLSNETLGVTAVGFYWGYKTDNTELTISELENGGSGITRNTVTLSSVTDTFSTTISSLPSETKISFAAFATNSVGTGEGSVISYTTINSSSAQNVPRLPAGKLFVAPVIDTNFPEYNHLGYGDFKKTDNSYYFCVFGGGGSGLASTRFNAGGKTVISSPTIDNDDFTNRDSSLDSITERKIDTWLVQDADVPNNAVHTIDISADGAISTEVQIVKGTVSGTRYTSTLTPSFSKTGTGDNILLATADIGGYQYNDPPTVPAATYKIGPFEQFNEGIVVIPFGTHTDTDNYSVGGPVDQTIDGTTTTFGRDNLGDATTTTFYNASNWSQAINNHIYAFNTQYGNGLDLTNDLDGANNDPGQYNFQVLRIWANAYNNDTFWTNVLSDLDITKTGSNFPFDGVSSGIGASRTVTPSSTQYFSIEWDNDTYMIVSATSFSFLHIPGNYGIIEFNGEIVAGNGTIDKTEGFTFRKNAAPAVKFDATKLDVSISGKTAGVDYNYYICDETPGLLGDNRLLGKWGDVQTCPAVVIEANPKILNNDAASATHTVNITYNY